MIRQRWAVTVTVVATALVAGSPGGRQSAHAAVSLTFGTTFDCPEWSQLSGTDPCTAGDGIGRYGNWTTSSGKGDQITSAANNPLGTGRGFRHWRGNGTNNQGGAISISFPPSRELWVRWYARFSQGFAWQNGAPHYTKELYFHPGETGAMIPGFTSGTYYIHSLAGSQNLLSSTTWANINGGSLGDGRFHCYEAYIKLDTDGRNGATKLWLDGRLVADHSGLNLGTRGPFDSFTLGSNQDYVINGDHYTDYDDVAVSITGAIGPIGGAPTLPLPAAPLNLRIVR